jgi:CRP-like cAMP-binding protein
MAATRETAAENHLLAALPVASRRRLLSRCEPVQLQLGAIILEPQQKLQHIYFPTSSFVSLVAALDARARLEVAMIGREGMLGIGGLLGVDIAATQVLVQGAGGALRVGVNSLRRELARSPVLQAVLYRYAYVLMQQIAQTAICTRYHLVEARLARWLLMTRDRARSREFFLTHEFMACLLGVRRVGITRAASNLQRQGVIEYRRGRITVLDERLLGKAACACYAAQRRFYAQVIG